MAAYFISDQQEVTDPDNLKIYGAGVMNTVNQYGGKVIVRDGDSSARDADVRFPTKGDISPLYFKV